MLRFFSKFILFVLLILSASCNNDSKKESLEKVNISKLDSLYIVAKQKKDDSLLNEALKKQIRFHYKEKDWKTFNKYRFEHIALTEKRNDTFAYAKTFEYTGNYFRFINQPDSAYYYYQKSFKNYDSTKDSLRAGSVLLNKAIVQKNVRDYKGSEITSFKALDYLLAVNHKRRIASIYNNLGIIYNQLQDMDASLKYHNLAKELRESSDKNPILVLHSVNNIGKVFADNERYDDALKNYRRLLNDSLLLKSPKLHAIVIDNNAYAHFKKGNISDSIDNNFKKALSIRDSIKDLNGIIINCIHLAEYYVKKRDTITALSYAEKAESLSQQTNNYRDYLRSLHLLSSLYPREEAIDHFNKYIVIRDSLDRVARSYEKSFEHIDFELEQKESIIEKQKEKITIRSKIIYSILVISSLIVIIILLKIRKRSVLNKQMAIGFRDYLINKYSLTEKNIIFWELWVTGITQKEISKKLFIGIEAVDSRRKSLKKKIAVIEKIEGDFDQAQAIIIYNTEKENFTSISSDRK